jgi:hypothetical protein
MKFATAFLSLILSACGCLAPATYVLPSGDRCKDYRTDGAVVLSSCDSGRTYVNPPEFKADRKSCLK